MNESILIIEDDAKLRSGLTDNLIFEGYQVSGTWNAMLGAKLWHEMKPALVILDLILPGKNGFRLLREMRALGMKTPVLILSARGEEWDKVKGFRLGCDDYMVKPFSIMELLERIRALLRRTSPPEPISDKIKLQGLELDLVNRILISGDQHLLLTGLQFELMAYFMRNPGRVISRKELLEKVWLVSPEVSTRTVDVYVSLLRPKLLASPYLIESAYKAGYILVPLRGILGD
jgi:DNA-binding response OmpR family regulator